MYIVIEWILGIPCFQTEILKREIGFPPLCLPRNLNHNVSDESCLKTNN